MDGNDILTWDIPTVPHKYANVVVVGKSVALVRHHFSEHGDVKEIFNEYLEGKSI